MKWAPIHWTLIIYAIVLCFYLDYRMDRVDGKIIEMKIDIARVQGHGQG